MQPAFDDELCLLRLLDRTKLLAREDLRAHLSALRHNVTLLEAYEARVAADRRIDVDIREQYAREVHELRLLVKACRNDWEDGHVVSSATAVQRQLDEIDKLPVGVGERTLIASSSQTFDMDSILSAPDDDHLPVDSTPVKSMSSLQSDASMSGLRARTRAIYKADLRKQLLGKAGAEDESSGRTLSAQELERKQEQLAYDLLDVTKQMKETMQTAGHVISEDNKRIESMQAKADSNTKQLKVEGERLARHAYKCGFDCLLVFIIVFVFWSFIAMVLMMRMFPKVATE